MDARQVIENLLIDVADARDNLMVSKISQSHFANPHRRNDFPFQNGDKVMLNTVNRRRDYKSRGQNRVAKFMPRYDGPYIIIDTHPAASTVTLDMPNTPNLFPTFHTSNIKAWHSNDDIKYPSRTLEAPGPIDVNGVEEFFVDSIIDHRKIGKGYRYLVHFKGFGSEDDRWISGSELDNNEALENYWKKHPTEFPNIPSCDENPPLRITLPYFTGSLSDEISHNNNDTTPTSMVTVLNP
jgi:hypothetical protein